MVILLAALVFMGCPDSKQGETFSNVAKKFSKEPEITVYMHKTKTTETMPIEEYLLDVVAGEMKPDWPVEAYAAQAIVARTFTMDFIASGGTQEEHGTDISTDEVEAQAYNAERLHPRFGRAVEMTKGKVMTYRGKYVRHGSPLVAAVRRALAKEGLSIKIRNRLICAPVSCPRRKLSPRRNYSGPKSCIGSEEDRESAGRVGEGCWYS